MAMLQWKLQRKFAQPVIARLMIFWNLSRNEKPVITPKNAIDFGRLIGDVTKKIPRKEEDSKEDE